MRYYNLGSTVILSFLNNSLDSNFSYFSLYRLRIGCKQVGLLGRSRPSKSSYAPDTSSCLQGTFVSWYRSSNSSAWFHDSCFCSMWQGLGDRFGILIFLSLLRGCRCFWNFRQSLFGPNTRLYLTFILSYFWYLCIGLVQPSCSNSYS